MDIQNPEFLLFLSCAQKNNLRYMCIGGYAVNYYGYRRITEDLDIWVAPTNENKTAFFDTLSCMGYTDEECADFKEEDFTTYFMVSIGPKPYVIDILTILHPKISFDDAEKEIVIHDIGNRVDLKIVSYNFLQKIKLLSNRPKDLYDIEKLDALRNKDM